MEKITACRFEHRGSDFNLCWNLFVKNMLASFFNNIYIYQIATGNAVLVLTPADKYTN